MINESTEAFFAALRKVPSSDILLVGIGNTLKADDGIGPEICSLLKESIPDNVIDTGTVPENYIQVITKRAPKILVFIDAIDFEEPPGTIKVFEAEELSTVGMTTHTLSPRLLSDIISQHILTKIFFVGIQPKSTVIGEPLSHEIQQAKEKLLKLFTQVFSLNDTIQ